MIERLCFVACIFHDLSHHLTCQVIRFHRQDFTRVLCVHFPMFDLVVGIQVRGHFGNATAAHNVCFELVSHVFYFLQRSSQKVELLLQDDGKELHFIGAYNFSHFSRKLFDTTLTLLSAIAAPAIIGFNKNPLSGYKTPAAMGIPMTL